MDNEIQLISDGDGLAVIGPPTAVERFLASESLPSKDFGLPRLGRLLGGAAGTAGVASEITAESGRWVKLTEESARALQVGELMKGSSAQVRRAVVTKDGKITDLLEIMKPGSMFTNPGVLAGAAGLMAQLAMQQTMDEITDYLAAIDKKVDDVLRAQKDAVLADMIGVDFVIEEAMIIREKVGRVSEVTWSKVQSTSATIARTQAYALRQLDALAESLERETKMAELAKVSKEAELKVEEWLAVLARCFQLQDATAVLELDRVLDASPEELDQHRLGLRVARQNRLELIAQTTERLMARMDVAAGRANAKVLLHPGASRTVVFASNHVAAGVVEFQGRLGIERARQSLEARRWVEAASEMRDKVLETGAEGIDAAGRLGNETLDRAKSVTENVLETGSDGVDAAGRLASETLDRAKSMRDKFSTRIAERTSRWKQDDEGA